MDLRWLLPTVALALPALAQDPAPVPVEAPKEAPAEVKPAEVKPAEAKPAEAKPAEVKPAEAKPAEVKPAETKAVEAKPAVAAPAPPPAPAPARPTSTSEAPAVPRAAAPVVEAPAEAPPPAAPPRAAPLTLSPTGIATSSASEPVNESDAQTVARIARVAFERLLAGDARHVTEGSAIPFYLDGRRFDAPEPLFRELLQQLRAKRTDLLTVDAIEVLTPEEMERKHGKPPARLEGLPWKAPNTWIAVASLSGRPAVAIFQKHPRGWRLVGYTD